MKRHHCGLVVLGESGWGLYVAVPPGSNLKVRGGELKKVKKQGRYKIYLYPYKNLHLNKIPDLNIPRRDFHLRELHISHSLPLFEGSLKGLSEEVSSLKAWSGHQT